MTAIDTSLIARQTLLRAAQGVASFVALMYHNVCDDDIAIGQISPSDTAYFVSSSAFAKQMAELSASALCMTRDMLDASYGTVARPLCNSIRYPMLLTFDDGWRDAVQVGGPILQQHGFQATLFITFGYLDRPHFLSMGEVSRLNQNVFRIGSHAMTHRMLCLLDEDEIRSELADSKRELEDLIGREVDSLSIPNGAVDRRVRRIASECGYRYVFDSNVRVNRGGSDPLSIGRVAVKRNTPMTTFSRFIQHRISGEWLRRAILTAPKQMLGLRRYDLVRRHLLGENR